MLRSFITLCLATILGLGGAHAQNPTALNFAFLEGSSSSGDAQYAADKYRPLVDDLGRFIKQDIKVLGVAQSKQLEAETFRNVDLVLVRPASVAGWLIYKLGYQPLVAINDGHSILVVGNGSRKFSAFSDLKGTRIAMPPAQTEASRAMLQALRGAGLTDSDYSAYYVNLQGTIPFALDNNLSDVGVIDSDAAVAQVLAQAKKPVLFRVTDLPPWVILGSNRLSEENLEKLKLSLLAFGNTPERKAMLQKLRFEKMQPATKDAYVKAFKTYYPEMAK